MGRERHAYSKLVERLIAEARQVRKEAESASNRRQQNRLFNRYRKLMARVEEMKNPTPLRLTRYE